MIRSGLILFFLFPALLIGQEMELKNKTGTLNITITISDSVYSLVCSDDYVCVGPQTWEEGAAKVLSRKIVLRSANPSEETSFKKMILKHKQVKETHAVYFTGKDGSFWEVTHVRNRKFARFVLAKKLIEKQ